MMRATTQEFFEVNDIIHELHTYIKQQNKFDVITIVGEGEPTLYSELGILIDRIKELTDKPVAVITNGSILYKEEVAKALLNADIVLPSLDASNSKDFLTINRHHKEINFDKMLEGIIEFSKVYEGQLWLETMLIDGINDNEEKLLKFKQIISKIKYDRLYINTPVRPPAEGFVKEPSEEKVEMAVKILGGISINHLISSGFASNIEDDVQAIESIIKRHPMNSYELVSFLESRGCKDVDGVMKKLDDISNIDKMNYKGYITYRLR